MNMPLRKQLTTSVLLLLASSSLSAATLYTNARVIDPDNRTIQSRHIEVEGDTITALYEAIPDHIPPAQQINLQHQFVMPGFVDMHVHAWGNAGPNDYMWTGTKGMAKAQLYSGVLAILDLFDNEDEVLNYRQQQSNEEAKLFAAGPCFTATGGHCAEYDTKTRVIDTPEQAKQQLIDLAAKSPDVVKVVYDHGDEHRRVLPTIDNATLTAFIQQAQQLSLKTIVHIGNWDDVRDAISAGADMITHIPMSPMPDDIPALMQRHGTIIIPTLTVHTELLYIRRTPDYFYQPLLRAVTTADLLENYQADLSNAARLQQWLNKHEQLQTEKHIDQAIKTLADHQVPFLVGTDSGNLATFHGFSFHRELQHLSEAGIDNWTILAAASTDAHRILGLNWSVAKGQKANFVVTERSPIDDIKNTLTISYIVKNGQQINRQSVQAMIEPDLWEKIVMFLRYPFT